MGVYIPNMEKPKDCEVCPFIILDGAVTDDNKWVSYSICDLLGKTIGDADMLNDCPLIEIVECKNCKYWADDMSGNMWCEHAIGGLTEANDFCSYGERREE